MIRRITLGEDGMRYKEEVAESPNTQSEETERVVPFCVLGSFTRQNADSDFKSTTST